MAAVSNLMTFCHVASRFVLVHPVPLMRYVLDTKETLRGLFLKILDSIESELSDGDSLENPRLFDRALGLLRENFTRTPGLVGILDFDRLDVLCGQQNPGQVIDIMVDGLLHTCEVNSLLRLDLSFAPGELQLERSLVAKSQSIAYLATRFGGRRFLTECPHQQALFNSGTCVISAQSLPLKLDRETYLRLRSNYILLPH